MNFLVSKGDIFLKGNKKAYLRVFLAVFYLFTFISYGFKKFFTSNDLYCLLGISRKHLCKTSRNVFSSLTQWANYVFRVNSSNVAEKLTFKVNAFLEAAGSTNRKAGERCVAFTNTKSHLMKNKKLSKHICTSNTIWDVAENSNNLKNRAQCA